MKGVGEDIEKLLTGDIHDAFKPAKAWTMAFITSEEVYQEMLRKRPGADHVVLYPQLQGDLKSTPQEQSMGPKIVLWTFEKELVKQ